MLGQNVIIMRQRGRGKKLFIPKEKQQLNKQTKSRAKKYRKEIAYLHRYYKKPEVIK